MAQFLKNKLINKRNIIREKNESKFTTIKKKVIPSKLDTSVSIISLTLPQKHVIPVYK